jgi:hypothetical protein
MASAYREGKRPQDSLHAEHDCCGLEGEFELVDRLLVARVTVASTIRDAQLGLGRVVEQGIEILVCRPGVDREP